MRVPKRYVIVLLLIALVACNKRPGSPIVTKFSAAGGGDAATADVASIAAWLMNRKDLTIELYNLCQPQFKNPPDVNWPNSDEGKICQAAVNNIPRFIKPQSDGAKF